MSALTLNQAAKEAKKSKAAIIEALKTGRLSGVKNDLGQWQIEPVELFRVYPQNQSVNSNENRSQPVDQNQSTSYETTYFEQELILVRAERDRERQQLQTTIDDLRHRLDMESEERRKLTAMLTHQNHAEPAGTAVKPATNRRMTWLVVLLIVVSVGAVLSLVMRVI